MKINFAARHNVRFWTWTTAGWVKLTLRPGDRLAAYSGGPDEEGYSYTVETWEYDEEIPAIVGQVTTNAQDCDGRLDQRWDGEATEYEDYEDPETGEIVRRLKWEKCGSSQRDHAAEAAGY